MTPQLSYYIKFCQSFDGGKKLVIHGLNVRPTPGGQSGVAGPIAAPGESFDADILRRAVEEAGFAIEHLEPFCYKDFPEKHRTNGEEFRASSPENLERSGQIRDGLVRALSSLIISKNVAAQKSQFLRFLQK